MHEKTKIGIGKIKYILLKELKTAEGDIFLEGKEYVVEQRDETNRIVLIIRIPRHLGVAYITIPEPEVT